jgi:SNF2 family DNA or RNA helicase
LLSKDVQFYVINHDGFNIIAEEAKGMFDLVIVDEAAVLRNPSTQRFKIFRRWIDANPSTRLWLMTGTPTPNDPTDAWALAKLVSSPHCTKTFTAFREQVMMKIGQWKFVPRPESVDIVKHILQPAVRYTRDECFDLPDTVIQTRQVELTAEQKKHYSQMLKHFVTEMTADGTITAVNEAVKIQKLVQIACGVAYGDDGQNIELDCTPRVNLVKEVIEEAGEKVIVFVPLTGTLHMLEKELSKHWSVGVVNGAVSASKRNQIFHDFQHAKHPHVLVAHPATMAHGLTLTSASTIIWYGPITSNEQYVQANGRIERIGKKHVSNVIHIEATDLEYRMYERLKNKQKLQGLLLDLIQQQTNR